MKPEILTLLSLIVTSITSISVAWIGFRIKQLERNTNSKMDQLLTTTATAKKAEGNLEGRAEQKAEHKAAQTD